jgi:hypothetical protein
MNVDGTTTATDGAPCEMCACQPTSRGRRLSWFSLFLAVLSAGACLRSTSGGAKQAQPGAEVDTVLARAIGRAVQPCIRAHQSTADSLYKAELRLEREPSGTAVASFLAGRMAGHEEFEACAVEAIHRAGIPLAHATTLPVAFNFGPNR